MKEKNLMHCTKAELIEHIKCSEVHIKNLEKQIDELSKKNAKFRDLAKDLFRDLIS